MSELQIISLKAFKDELAILNRILYKVKNQ